MTQILKPNKKTRGTHAIVIGVGEYKHLLNGTGKPFKPHENMKQLTSPPESARVFAKWLLEEYNNPKNNSYHFNY